MTDSILPINILLADDDKDDRFFFGMALKKLPILTELSTVEDGEMLIDYLLKNIKRLPDILFLDLNMPRKNGSECLEEIKNNEELKAIPVIIYSTSMGDAEADHLYKNGAHYYVRKADLNEIELILHKVLTLLLKNDFERPSRKEFILNLKD